MFARFFLTLLSLSSIILVNTGISKPTNIPINIINTYIINSYIFVYMFAKNRTKLEKPPNIPTLISIKINLLKSFSFMYLDKYEPIPIAHIYRPIVIENCVILSPCRYELRLLIINSYIIEHIDINKVVNSSSFASNFFVCLVSLPYPLDLFPELSSGQNNRISRHNPPVKNILRASRRSDLFHSDETFRFHPDTPRPRLHRQPPPETYRGFPA